MQRNDRKHLAACRLCRLCLLGLLLLAGYETGYSQDAQDRQLQQAVTFYEEGAYDQSVTALRDLVSQPLVPQIMRIEAYKYLGFNYWEQGNIDQAKREFKNALTLNRQLQLGSEVSPLIVATFGEALTEFLNEQNEQERQKRLSTTKSGATFRSLVAPGWGQMYRGHTKKGLAVAGVGAATVVGFILADRAYRDAQSKYDNALTGDPFDALAREAGNKSDRANLWMYGVAAVWGINLIDALIAGPNMGRFKGSADRGERRSRFGMGMQDETVMVGYQVSF